jgi:hypothetical protein
MNIAMPVPFRMHPIMSHQSPVSIHAPAMDDLLKENKRAELSRDKNLSI